MSQQLKKKNLVKTQSLPKVQTTESSIAPIGNIIKDLDAEIKKIQKPKKLWLTDENGKKVECPKLPKKFKAKWVKALRSGKYKKTVSQLAQKHEVKGEKPQYQYCVLGVAGKICGISDSVLEEYGNLDKDIVKNKNVPKILVEGESLIPDKLISMNDGGRYSFNKLADWIETNL